MSAEDKVAILIRDVPGDIARELDARAAENYRSRNGEVLAILTAVCRGHIALPVSMDGATLAVVQAAQEALIPDEDLEPVPCGGLGLDGPQRPDGAAEEPAGGEV